MRPVHGFHASFLRLVASIHSLFTTLFYHCNCLRGQVENGINEMIQVKERPFSILEVRKRLLLNYHIYCIIHSHLCLNNLEGGRISTLIRLGFGRQWDRNCVSHISIKTRILSNDGFILSEAEVTRSTFGLF